MLFLTYHSHEKKHGNYGLLCNRKGKHQFEPFKEKETDLQDDKRFIKVSPNHVGVKNYSSCIVQSVDVDWAKISEQESSLNRRKYVILPTNSSDSLGFFLDSIAYMELYLLINQTYMSMTEVKAKICV